ncbi:MAG: hypothetical protein V2B15_19355 [Bacteroidota bacterium]
MKRIYITFGTGLILLACTASQPFPQAIANPPVPVIDGEFWQIAGNPDLGDLTGPDQQPVDFGIWQAADGTWQLWSCIRKTLCGGHTRLFHGWEGNSLTEVSWKPVGITMMADSLLGEQPGGLQAPHVIVEDGVYSMFYGDWSRICLARGRNGKNFQRVLNPETGEPGLFTEDFGEPHHLNHARDAMVLKNGETYHCYYTSHSNLETQEGAAYCRTSNDLVHWSESVMVSRTPPYGSNSPKYSDECPHVVYLEESGYYYLFVTQIYGQQSQTTVYASPDPLSFGIGDDSRVIARLPVAAPEILFLEGQWYIASTMPGLDGIHMARLKWEAR